MEKSGTEKKPSSGKHMSRARAMLLFVTLPAVLVVSGGLFYFDFFSDKIHKGIYFEGADIGGMTRDEARKTVNALPALQVQNKSIILGAEKKRLELRMQDINAKADTEKVVQDAWLIGRTGDMWKRIHDVIQVKTQGLELHSGISFNREKLKKILTQYDKSMPKSMKNAYFTLDPGNVVNIVPEQSALSIDIDKSMRLVEDNIEQRKFGQIMLPVNINKPEITAELLKPMNTVLGQFKTEFNPNDLPRTANMKQACSKLNGLLIKPGDVFSMNGTLGERTKANGYTEAKVIIKNVFVEGVGGGVCQVTSTLYGAVLRSRLEVTERRNHSVIIPYVDPGQDATVSEDSIDFKFRNSSDAYAGICATLSGKELTMTIVGKGSSSENVRIVSNIVQYLPPEEETVVDVTLSPLQRVRERPAQKGLKVKVYREIFNGNVLVERQLISQDTYKPINGLTRVGPEITAEIFESENNSE